MHETGMILLTIIATLTSLATEGIKKAFGLTGKKFSLNILAAIVSVISALLVSFGYIILADVAFTPKTIVYIVALICLSFLTSTCGYDKVKEAIKQLNLVKQLQQKEE